MDKLEKSVRSLWDEYRFFLEGGILTKSEVEKHRRERMEWLKEITHLEGLANNSAPPHLREKYLRGVIPPEAWKQLETDEEFMDYMREALIEREELRFIPGNPTFLQLGLAYLEAIKHLPNVREENYLENVKAIEKHPGARRAFRTVLLDQPNPLTMMRHAHEDIDYYLRERFREEHFTVADVGCYNGEATERLQSRLPNASVVGVDRFYSLDFAVEGKNAKYVVHNVLEAPLPLKEVDCVIAATRFMPLLSYHKVKALTNMARSVRDGGIIIIGPHETVRDDYPNARGPVAKAYLPYPTMSFIQEGRNAYNGYKVFKREGERLSVDDFIYELKSEHLPHRYGRGF